MAAAPFWQFQVYSTRKMYLSLWQFPVCDVNAPAGDVHPPAYDVHPLACDVHLLKAAKIWLGCTSHAGVVHPTHLLLADVYPTHF